MPFINFILCFLVSYMLTCVVISGRIKKNKINDNIVCHIIITFN